ncbi:hypothetical protein SDC9_188112 [bioreactor metagenome]|uniref:Uncharacterized protein n=1 Tax=bioreactor metagenome TaxID=1076179 RepID=A0A645HWL2_9ZZZZ|nr:hypothetical protein [Lutispora sp.]MEA4964159.1 hypothetical protein [Lutispora sp.]
MKKLRKINYLIVDNVETFACSCSCCNCGISGIARVDIAEARVDDKVYKLEIDY